MATAFHILFWMGAKRIYLIGCYFNTGKGDYHHGQYKLSIDNKKWNQSLYNNLVNWLKKFTPMAQKYGVEIISCTPDSPINNFMRYVTIEEAVRNYRVNIPWGGKLYHAREID